jgi:hypothetical protein
MQRAFVIRPFGTKKDSAGTDVDFEHIHKVLIGPALMDAGLGGGTTGEIIESGNVREDMFALIVAADLVVCDVTLHNANVFYELGIRHALRKKRSILIRGGPVKDAPPFDLLTDRYLGYKLADPAASRQALVNTIRATLAANRDTDSPVFRLLPTLPEANPASVQTLPRDFVEEVARARAVRSPGWLGLLSSDVTASLFQWPALRLIGQAQLDLKDFHGARSTWERVRANDPDDLSANLKLSDVYQRLFLAEKHEQLFVLSNQAVDRALDNPLATTAQRAEASALKARNLKTIWQKDFVNVTDTAKRRHAATNQALREAYKAYRAAFMHDLNHYWSGLAALQQGTIAADLAREESWEYSFETKEQSLSYKAELDQQLALLRPSVAQSIAATLARPSTTEDERRWARISSADLKFLTEEKAERVIRAYQDSIPANGFYWNAARGQLELFATLGVKADLAKAVITAIDAQVGDVSAAPPVKTHLLVFAGHRIDEPGRAERRFPADREPQALQLIAAALDDAKKGWDRLSVMASAAPGSDIICHEVCRELGIASTVCLPMPRDVVATKIFGELDEWRGRYLELLNQQAAAQRPVLELSDRDGLPRWLQTSGMDPWERGNRWVLEMARASGAQKVTLIALWDGKLTGDAQGGTAHMVRLARETQGSIDIKIIKAGQLLG